MCAVGGPGVRCDQPLAPTSRPPVPSVPGPGSSGSSSSSRLGGGLGVATSSRSDRTCIPRAQPLPSSPSSVLRAGSRTAEQSQTGARTARCDNKQTQHPRSIWRAMRIVASPVTVAVDCLRLGGWSTSIASSIASSPPSCSSSSRTRFLLFFMLCEIP